jgi:hypothetical protein
MVANVKQVALVLAANQYSFLNDDKERVAGSSLHYVLTENLAPVEDTEKNSKGYRPAKASLPYEAYEDSVQEVPGFYNLLIEVQPGSDGKIKAAVTGLEFIRPLVKPKS